MSKHVIIVAGGSGTRMGASIPKQFMELQSKPILMHSIKRFYTYDKQIHIVVVLPKKQVSYWQQLCETHQFLIPHEVIIGGAERYYSVKNGLSSLTQYTGYVAIHDAVRPLVSQQTIKLAFESALLHGSGIPVIPLHDSIRKTESQNNFSVDRNHYKIVQTPQCFNLENLTASYERPFQTSFTDDASVYEYAGHKIHLTSGNPENLKITTPQDLKTAEVLFDGVL